MDGRLGNDMVTLQSLSFTLSISLFISSSLSPYIFSPLLVILFPPIFIVPLFIYLILLSLFIFPQSDIFYLSLQLSSLSLFFTLLSLSHLSLCPLSLSPLSPSLTRNTMFELRNWGGRGVKSKLFMHENEKKINQNFSFFNSLSVKAKAHFPYVLYKNRGKSCNVEKSLKTPA